MRADTVGCIEPLDDGTGARLHGFAWSIDPWAWELGPDGETVWTLHEDSLVARRIGDDRERPTTIARGEDEGVDVALSPDGAVAWLEGERHLTARALRRAGPRDPRGCAEVSDDGHTWLEDGMYDLTPRHDPDWATVPGRVDDALLDPDGRGWWEVVEGTARHWRLQDAPSAPVASGGHLVTAYGITLQVYRLPGGELRAEHQLMLPSREAAPAYLGALYVDVPL